MANGFLLRGQPFTAAAGNTSALLVAGSSWAHVADDRMGLVARTAAGGTWHLAADLGASPPPVDTLALLNVLAPDEPWEIRSGSTNDLAAATSRLFSGFSAADLPSTQGRRHILMSLAAPVTARWWHVAITPSAGFAIEAARLVLGTRWQPSRNFEFGLARGARDLGEMEFARGGAFSRARGARLRTLQISWPLVSMADAEGAVLPLLEWAGSTEFVLACIDPDAHPQRSRRAYFGPLRGDPAIGWRVWDGWESRLSLESVI